jgi:hypothetical protein
MIYEDLRSNAFFVFRVVLLVLLRFYICNGTFFLRLFYSRHPFETSKSSIWFRTVAA